MNQYINVSLHPDVAKELLLLLDVNINKIREERQNTSNGYSRAFINDRITLLSSAKKELQDNSNIQPTFRDKIKQQVDELSTKFDELSSELNKYEHRNTIINQSSEANIEHDIAIKKALNRISYIKKPGSKDVFQLPKHFEPTDENFMNVEQSGWWKDEYTFIKDLTKAQQADLNL